MEPEDKDLVLELSNLRQGNDEDAQRFVMRGIDIVHQFGAKKKQRMSESMAFEILLEGLETGFVSDNIRNRMRPYLEDKLTSEKTLLRAIKHAKKSEVDRKSKFDRRATPKVNELSVVDDSVMAVMLAKVEGLSSDIAEVKQHINNNKTDNKENTPPAAPVRVIYGCKSCKAKGQGTTCTHCFKCEEGGHKSFECPKNSLNPNRSPMGAN